MTRRLVRRLVVLLALVLPLVVAGPALAESARTVSYPMDRVWPAVLRLLRVDMKLHIVEKDREGGYVIFEYLDEGRTFRAAAELLPARDGKGRDATRIAIKIEGRPSYSEEGLLTRLETKLKAELGEPVAPPPKAPPPAPAPPPGAEADKPKAP
jgi:hypothetical protein